MTATPTTQRIYQKEEFDPCGTDHSLAMSCALTRCREEGTQVLVLPKDTYHFHPDFSAERFCFISNNDSGLKRVAFDLTGMTNFTIDGNGSLLVFHGWILPFLLQEGQGITLLNFSIDWESPFHFQGDVVAVDPDTNSFELKVFDECIYQLRGGQLFFLEKQPRNPKAWLGMALSMQQDVGWVQNLQWTMWYETESRRPWFGEELHHLHQYNQKLDRYHRVEELAPNHLRIYDAAVSLPEPGMTLVLKGRLSKNRYCPAIFAECCTDTCIKNVTVHHAGGMGLIAQRCTDVTLDGFDVTLPPESRRIITTTADATHFVGCRGKIRFIDCTFENMLDDATNVHGMYVKIAQQQGPQSVRVRRMHSQQVGTPFAGVGDRLRFSEHARLAPLFELTVANVTRLNEEVDLIEFTEDLPQDIAGSITDGLVADNLSWQPDVEMRRVTVRNNRARSVLFSTAGKVLVEDCDFSACTFCSVLLDSNADFWYESGPVRDLTIRRCRFRDFGLGSKRGPVFKIGGRLELVAGDGHYFHQNILIEENELTVCNPAIIDGVSVKSLTFRGNTIRKSTAFPFVDAEAPAFRFGKAAGIVIEENQFTDGLKDTRQDG